MDLKQLFVYEDYILYILQVLNIKLAYEASIKYWNLWAWNIEISEHEIYVWYERDNCFPETLFLSESR